MKKQIECCGIVCKTPYCPLCGTKLNQPHKLSGLLSYVSLQTEKARKKMEDAKLRSAKNATFRLENLFTKWATWEIAIIEAIDRDQLEVK